MNLRECPFCGGTASFFTQANRNAVSVGCTSCGFKSRILMDGAGGREETLCKLEEMWNHRQSDKVIKDLKADAVGERNELQRQISGLKNDISELKELLAMSEADWLAECYSQNRKAWGVINRKKEEETDELIDNIIDLWDIGTPYKEISSKLHVSASFVNQITARLTWYRKNWKWKTPQEYRKKKQQAV